MLKTFNVKIKKLKMRSQDLMTDAVGGFIGINRLLNIHGGSKFLFMASWRRHELKIPITLPIPFPITVIQPLWLRCSIERLPLITFRDYR